jgi:hypothetical protein
MVAARRTVAPRLSALAARSTGAVEAAARGTVGVAGAEALGADGFGEGADGGEAVVLDEDDDELDVFLDGCDYLLSTSTQPKVRSTALRHSA